MGRVWTCALVALLVPGVLFQQAVANVNIDGGRSQLPGMRHDMFDQAQQKKKMGARGPSKGPPECPKSDGMSPFWGFTFINGEMFVKLNSTQEPCQRLLAIGGANLTVLKNASLTCGPVGEWKRRIAEHLSAVFFQAGLEWVKHENETIEVTTENGTFEVGVTEEKFAEQSTCWASGCDCEQAKNPVGRAILYTLMAIGIIGILADSVKLGFGKGKDNHEDEKEGKKEKKERKSKESDDEGGKKEKKEKKDKKEKKAKSDDESDGRKEKKIKKDKKDKQAKSEDEEDNGKDEGQVQDTTQNEDSGTTEKPAPPSDEGPSPVD